MKRHRRASISDFLDDNVVYRNLIPLDNRLPKLDEFREAVGLPAERIPRKSEADYARAIAYILRRAQNLRSSDTEIKRLIFIGDTRLNDGNAFANICRAGEWPGLAFIGSETTAAPSTEIVPAGEAQRLFLANRWALLADFEQFCADEGFLVNEQTVVIVDIDKTALGARGRNDHTIDRARVQAVQHTVAGLLGGAFDEDAFLTAYKQLNQVEFHPFTGDNQDYLAYICLILGSGLYALEAVVNEIHSGQLAAFEQFISRVDSRAKELSPELAAIHAEIYSYVQAGDPTPFKMFRRNEYVDTLGLMGCLDDAASVEDLLADEIVITGEVYALARKWRQQGALLFGLSDKPDEASVPTPELAAQGYAPIHKAVTHVV